MVETIVEAFKTALPLAIFGLLFVVSLVVGIAFSQRIMDRWFGKTDRDLVENLMDLNKSLVRTIEAHADSIQDLDRRVSELESED